jgi:uncharacterized protein
VTPAIIDTNVYLSRWPFRRLPGDEPSVLIDKLRSHGVTQAWAGSFDGLWHRDLAAVNQRLVDACAAAEGVKLLPFGSVNPKLPDWREDLRRCHEVHRMPGIRLHPNYHGYRLDDPDFAALLQLAAERGMIVQVALSMEDERTQPTLVQVPHVDTVSLPALVASIPKLRLVILNAFRALRIEQVDKLAAAGEVYFELAMLEGVAGIERLLKVVSLERVLFGSLYPLFYFESALLKLQESALPGGHLNAICHANAERLLGPGK